MAGADRLDQVALEGAAFDVVTEGAQLLLVGGAALRDLGFFLVDDR